MFLLCEYTSASISCPMYFFIVWNILLQTIRTTKTLEVAQFKKTIQ